MDTIIAANSPPPGSTRHNFSPWLFLDAAHVLFQTAKSRVYRGKISHEVSTSSPFPSTLQPVLEEQPKWRVLTEVLEEIEQDSYFNPANMDESNNTTLVMCSDQRTCRQLREYLGTMHVKVENAPDEETSEENPVSSAEIMMRRKLRDYLDWKRSLSNVNRNLSSKPASEESQQPGKSQASPAPSPNPQARAPPNKRRRVRGGGIVSSAAGRIPNSTVQTEVELPGQVTSLLDEIQPTAVEETQKEEIIVDDLEDMEDFYEVYDMDSLVVVHPYDGDMDEHILEEIRPRYIIMYEPDPAFIRRVEVYRSSHVGRNVKVYFIYYGGSVEEQRYLSAVRREKDSFSKLIKEKGVSQISGTSKPKPTH